MKLPSLNTAQAAATPANKLDIRHGKLDAAKLLLFADWEDQPDGSRLGKPTATFWRAWKIRKKSIFGAGVRPETTPDGMRLRWRSKEGPLPPLALSMPTRAAKTPPRASQRVRRAVRLTNTKDLLAHQPVAVARHLDALAAHGGSLEASTTGVGKTFIALAVAREMGFRPAIVCPKNIISGWEEAAALLGVSPLFVNNYEQLKIGNQAGVDTEPFRWKLPKKSLVIFDEAHRLKNQMSINGALAISAAACGMLTMQLSATIAQDPTEMFVTGLLLGLHKGGQSFLEWAQEYGCAFDGMGLTWRGTDDDIQRLHLELFPDRGSRIRAQDIEDFPDSKVIAKSLDCDDAEALQAIYESMADEMARHEEKLQGDGIKLLNALCAMTRARQHAELLKVPMMVELIDDLVREGHSVPVFVNFSETLDALAQRLDTDCIIRGGQTKKARDSMKLAFQSDSERIILCQMRAGGESISLHDTHGNHPRASVISPSFSAREIIQACGRTPRAGAKSKCLQYIVFAHGTIEDAACRQVQRKAGNIERLNDGDLAAGFKIVPTLKK